MCCFVFFFFKQKTAYEMVMSDWSSDVCSSDLARTLPHYHELRYEDLLDDPEAKLREVCAFLGLGFDAHMLDHGDSGARHVAQLGDRMTPDGRAMVPKALRARIHENLARP